MYDELLHLQHVRLTGGTGAGLLLLIGCAIGAQLYNYKVSHHSTVHMKFYTLLILLHNPFCKIWPLTFVVVEGFLNVK
jgi:hypothetical protein